MCTHLASSRGSRFKRASAVENTRFSEMRIAILKLFFRLGARRENSIAGA